MTSNTKRLTLRDAAIIRACWIISTEERNKLDKFFRVMDTWDNLVPDFSIDDVELKRFLKHEGHEYEVILASPVRILKAAKELGLSFRVNNASGLKIVLIKEWSAALTVEASNG